MRNKTSGFSLVEVVVVMAVASILMLAAGSVLVSGNRTYHYYAMTARAGEIGDFITEQMRVRLQYAEYIMIADEEVYEEDFHFIGFTGDGNFLIDERYACGNLPETGLQCRCRIDPPSGDFDVLQMEIELTDLSGNVLYQNAESFKLLNMGLSGEHVDWRISKRETDVDSEEDVFFYYLESGRRYEGDE